MNIVFLDAASVADSTLEPLQRLASQWHAFDSCPSEHRLTALAQADIAITNKVPLDAPLLAQLPKLKLICIAATGSNNVDLLAASKLGIRVCNSRGYSTSAVVQHCWSLLLALTNQLHSHHQQLQRWPTSPFFCQHGAAIYELAGKTLLIIGNGALGQAMAAVAKQFGMIVLVAEHKGQSTCRAGRVSFAQGLAQADVISLHCPLSDATVNLISQAEFAQMKPSALIINTARGGIINEHDLLHALKRRQIAGAAIDVLATEPPAADHPLLNYAQIGATLHAKHCSQHGTDTEQDWGSPLWLTPHIAWASVESRQRLITDIAQTISEFLTLSVSEQHDPTVPIRNQLNTM